MWTISLRDLQFRRRRFAIAVGGAALVFAISLAMSGVSRAFRAEAQRATEAVGADAWVLPRGAAGPYSSYAPFPASVAGRIAQRPEVKAADPLIVLRHTVRSEGGHEDVNIIAHRVGGLGAPPVSEGRAVASRGEAVASDRLGLKIGDLVSVAGRRFKIVGLARNMTFLAGIPVLYISLPDGQRITAEGRRIATAIATKGTPEAVPRGFVTLSNQDAIDDALRPLKNGIGAVDAVQFMMWLVAAAIIGAVIYLSALERLRDFAVLRAVGASGASLFRGLALQAIVASLAAAVLGAVVAQALVPTFPLVVSIPPAAFYLLPAVAVLVGLLASLTGLRRATGVDPARAFGGP